MPERQLELTGLRGTRRLTVDAGSGPVCLFLDGDFYRDRIGLPDLGRWGLRAATLSAGTPADRHQDFVCSDDFVAFVEEEVLPALDGPVEVLVGVSLSGLAAAHLAWVRPERFPRIVAQSPSAWWNDGWLAQRVSDEPARAWFSVGSEERQTEVRHPPTGMLQVRSQWDSVGELAAAWGARGRLETFEGGHEVGPWRAELVEAIEWVVTTK